jgi:hypothetical protein
VAPSVRVGQRRTDALITRGGDDRLGGFRRYQSKPWPPDAKKKKKKEEEIANVDEDEDDLDFSAASGPKEKTGTGSTGTRRSQPAGPSRRRTDGPETISVGDEPANVGDENNDEDNDEDNNDEIEEGSKRRMWAAPGPGYQDGE